MDPNCVFHSKSLDKLEKAVEVIKDGVVQIRLETASTAAQLSSLHNTIIDITSLVKDHETRIKDLKSTADKYSGIGKGAIGWLTLVGILTNAMSYAVASASK